MRVPALQREPAAQQVGPGAATAAAQAAALDLSFRGPIDSFDDADVYLRAIQGLSQIVTGADKHKVFVDGNDVCVIHDLKTAPVPSAPTAEWYRIRDGRIAAIRVFFDARPFASLFEVCSPLLRGRELGSGS